MPLTHISFVGDAEPPSESLWRYLSFQKFAALIELRELHFAGLSKFERDVHDGRVPPRMRAEAGDSTPSGHIVDGLDLLQGIGWTLELAEHEFRPATAVCCWNIGRYEADSMWQAYVRGPGVVIRSDWDRLVRSTAASDRILRGGRVLYPETEDLDSWFPDPNVMAFAFRKRPLFAGDREFRLMATDWPNKDGPIIRHGFVDVGVDLSELIAEVRLAPKSKPWEFELIRRMCARHGLSVPIEYSDLDAM